VTQSATAETILLEKPVKETYAFTKAAYNADSQRDFCKAMASAYLVFTQEGQALRELDSPESFTRLYELHLQLTDEAHAYLSVEVPFVYEGQPIQPLLLNFAAHRITKASQQYLAATLQDKPQSLIAALKSQIQAHQFEYDAILNQI
jgi:hypothetical protein